VHHTNTRRVLIILSHSSLDTVDKWCSLYQWHGSGSMWCKQVSRQKGSSWWSRTRWYNYLLCYSNYVANSDGDECRELAGRA
jgi:hypothetical protein